MVEIHSSISRPQLLPLEPTVNDVLPAQMSGRVPLAATPAPVIVMILDLDAMHSQHYAILFVPGP